MEFEVIFKSLYLLFLNSNITASETIKTYFDNKFNIISKFYDRGDVCVAEKRLHKLQEDIIGLLEG